MNHSRFGCSTGLLAALVLSALASPIAQTPAPSSTGPRFEVASIRLNTSLAEGPTALRGITGEVGRYTSTTSTRVLIQQAYQVPFIRQIGGPDWIREDAYVINARIPDDVERTPENTSAMLRNLLKDRFKLVAHEEERELPIYTLAHARADKRLGPKLQLSNCPPRVSGVPPTNPANAAGVKWDQGPRCGQIGSSRNFIVLGGFPLPRLIDLIQSTVGRTVVDRTGLTGDYVAEVTFAPLQAAPGPGDSDAPSFFTAVQEQLGLKLEDGRGPVKVLVIESIKRPSEN